MLKGPLASAALLTLFTACAAPNALRRGGEDVVACTRACATRALSLSHQQQLQAMTACVEQECKAGGESVQKKQPPAPAPAASVPQSGAPRREDVHPSHRRAADAGPVALPPRQTPAPAVAPDAPGGGEPPETITGLPDGETIESLTRRFLAQNLTGVETILELSDRKEALLLAKNFVFSSSAQHVVRKALGDLFSGDIVSGWYELFGSGLPDDYIHLGLFKNLVVVSPPKIKIVYMPPRGNELPFQIVLTPEGAEELVRWAVKQSRTSVAPPKETKVSPSPYPPLPMPAPAQAPDADPKYIITTDFFGPVDSRPFVENLLMKGLQPFDKMYVVFYAAHVDASLSDARLEDTSINEVVAWAKNAPGANQLQYCSISQDGIGECVLGPSPLLDQNPSTGRMRLRATIIPMRKIGQPNVSGDTLKKDVGIVFAVGFQSKGVDL